MKKKVILLLSVFLILTIGLIGYRIYYGPTKHTKNLFYMDTYIEVNIYSSNDKLVEEAFVYIDNLYKEYHELTDRYNEYEGITNIYYINNILDKKEELALEPKLYDLIKYGYDMFLNTGGKINIALGNVIDVWKVYREKGVGIPTEKELDVNIDINDIILDDSKHSIKKENDISIDLGAIVKGYVTELASDYLKEIGLNKFLINAGGNVSLGDHYKNSLYKVGIKKPIKDSKELYKIINVENKSVVTSGSYERFYEYKGEVYHHIIDPSTLYPPRNALSVTVVSDSSKQADFLSTYLFLMPIEDGIKYINNLKNVEAVWYSLDGEIYTSNGFVLYE